jgi:hypothetical protein
MNKLHWEQIPRGNNPSKPLQEKAVNLLAVIVHKLQKTEVVTLNHNYLSRITKCGKDQNVNLLRQLDDVLDIYFHAKVTIGKTIHRNCYVIQHTEKGRAIIENPEVLLTQKHFVGNIVVSSIEKTSTEDKKDTSCAEFFPSFSIYKEEVLENRSNKSNFLENSFEKKIIKLPSSDHIQESRVVTVNKIKNTFAKAKELKDFYPLTRDDCQILQSSSKREFSLNSMNEILLDMSKRLTDRYFKSKKGFLSYMSKVFSYEMRDAVKINNENFKIRNNKSKEEQDASQQEEYLTKIEYNLEVSPEWHFKKRLAARLPRKTAYKLLKSFDAIDIKAGIFNLHLSKYVDLTDIDKKLILQEAQSTHEKLDFADERLGYIQDIKIIMPEKITSLKHINQNITQELSLPIGIWGRVRQRLISIYGEAIDRNWFSKLTPCYIDEKKKEIKLKVPTGFVRDWINQNYLSSIESIFAGEQIELVEVVVL